MADEMLCRVVPCCAVCFRAEVRRVREVQHATWRLRIVEADERACPIDETGVQVRNGGAAQGRMGALRAAS
jgi:hypothetical protein